MYLHFFGEWLTPLAVDKEENCSFSSEAVCILVAEKIVLLTSFIWSPVILEIYLDGLVPSQLTRKHSCSEIRLLRDQNQYSTLSNCSATLEPSGHQ